MAILSNINGKFAIESSGAIQLSGSAGTSGYVLKSNGTGSAASWVDPTTIIGGPYLPLSGGTLTGATATASGISFTVGGTLTGTTATFSSNISAPVVQANVLNNQANSANIIYRSGTQTLIGGGSSSQKVKIEDNGTTYVQGEIINSMAAPKIQLQPTTQNNASIIELGVLNGGTNAYARIDAINLFNYDSNLRFWTNAISSTTQVERMRITSDGDVGIGYTSPAAKLHVGSTGTNAYSATITKGSNMKGIINTLSNNADDMVGIYFATGTTTEGTHWSGITGSRSDNASHWGTQLNFYTHNNDVANLNDATQKMVIKGDGNVGIGTTAPTRQLEVNTSGGWNNGISLNSSSVDGAGLRLNCSATGGNEWYLISTGSGNGGGAGNLGFYNNTVGDYRMYITSSGNVGIGDTSPAKPLVVYSAAPPGGITIKAQSGNASNWIQNVSTGSSWQIGSTSTGWQLYNDNTSGYRVTVTNAGNVGIGNTSPGAKLTVGSNAHGNATGIEVSAGSGGGNIIAIDGANNHNWFPYTDGNNYYSADNHTFRGGTNNTPNYMIIKSDGNVGINTTSPSAKLEAVYTGGYNAGIKVRSTSGFAVLTMEASSGSYPIVEFKEAGTQKWQIYNEPNDDSLNFYAFGSGASTKMNIQHNGNVGIGTISPPESLEISGNMAVRDTHKIYFNHNTNTNRYIGASSSNDLDIAADDDINYRSNYNRFFNGGTEFARLSGSTSSWIANGSNGKLGIGKTNPAYPLDVNGGIASTGTNVSFATAPLSWQANGNTGTYTQTVIYANQSNSSGIINNAAVFIERGRLTNSASGEIRHLIIGSRGGQSQFTFASERLGINNDSPSAQLHLTANASNSVPFKLQGHNSTSVEQMLIYSGQSAGTGWYNIVAQAGGINQLIIYGNGNIQNANNSYGQISDERLKENIVDTTPKLEDIKKIKVKNFNFIGDDLKQIGMIAQEVEEVFPGLVEEIKQPDVEDVEGGTYKSIKYSVLVPILIKAIQELEARVKELENK